MALNFPASPNDGDIYENYVWNATVGAWQSLFSGGGGGSIEISSTAPESPSDGDMWWDPDNGNLYIYYDDGTTQQWVAANGPQVVVSTSAPAGYQGQMWFDSTEGKVYIYYDDGTTGQWVSAIGGSLAGSVLQVVNGTATTPVTTNSTTFVTTGITASITPSSASNKILIIATGELMNTGSSNATLSTLFRGTVSGTNLSSSGAFNKIYGDNYDRGAISISYLDSPATTSSVTYTVGFRTDNASFTSYALTDPSLGSIILMEIAG